MSKFTAVNLTSKYGTGKTLSRKDFVQSDLRHDVSRTARKTLQFGRTPVDKVLVPHD